MEECSDGLPPGLREREDLPAESVSLPVLPGGVMMRVNAGTADGKTTDAGLREVSCGVAALAGARGNIPESRVSGRLPEASGASLKSRLGAGAFHWLDPIWI